MQPVGGGLYDSAADSGTERLDYPAGESPLCEEIGIGVRNVKKSGNCRVACQG